jgi:hypothetical protein
MWLAEDGFLYVHIRRDDGEWVTRPVHELVAEAWLPNPEGKTRVRHRDGCTTNNSADNLEWF